MTALYVVIITTWNGELAKPNPIAHAGKECHSPDPTPPITNDRTLLMVGKSRTDAIVEVFRASSGPQKKGGKGEKGKLYDKGNRGEEEATVSWPELNNYWNYWNYISTRVALPVSALADRTYRLAIQRGVIMPWGGGSSA